MSEGGNWVFRVRIRTKTPIGREHLPATLVVPGFPPIEVKMEKRPETPCTFEADQHCPQTLQPPPGGEIFTFIARGYPAEDAAHQAGRTLMDSLLIAGAVGAMGVDVGFSRATASYSKAVQDSVRAVAGRELRPDYVGLMTYEHETVAIINTRAEGFTTTSSNSVQDQVCRWLSVAPSMTERQRTCASLLNDSFYVSQVDAQFVLRVSAIEALCDQRDVEAEYVKVIDDLLGHLDAATATDKTRESVRRLLKRGRRESLRQAYMRKLKLRLGSGAADEFDDLYQLRSSFVHDGKGRGALQEPSNRTLDLARKLLEADLMAGSDLEASNGTRV